MQALSSRYKILFTDRQYRFSFVLAVFMLLLSLLANSNAITYATEKASNSVTDVVLDNVPLVDVDGISVYGPILLWLIVAFLCLQEPKRFPFVMKSLALFITIRCVFVSLTHIGPFADQVHILGNLSWIQKLTYGGDLFFSGHTGSPFLMALVFFQSRKLFTFFTGTAMFFGIIVLLAHLHYTIDVLSAFFITYSIYKISEYIFTDDRKMLMETLPGT